ncbi:MAG: ABC transporter permease subunit [Rhizobiaceae bacterium]|nr:ABC transporter permease subunit [Rhizobiaceae bacterium]
MAVDRFSVLFRLLGAVSILVLWEIAGRQGWLGTSFPPLSEIFGVFENATSRRLFARAVSATLYASAIAFVIGALFALVLALLSFTQPWSERGLDTMASSLYAVPTISFGPVFILLAGPANTAIVLGALSTFFPIYVALTSALRFAPRGYDDLATVVGASRQKSFFLLKLPHAVPAFVDGLRMGAPAAVLGVILGEWFGASRGLGIVIISSLQNVRISQLWAAACLSIACTFGAYVLLTVIYRAAYRRFAW